MMNHHNISPTWLAVNLSLETLCLLFFWLEFLFKWAGYGLGTYLSQATNRLDFFVLFATSGGYVGSVLSAAGTILGVIPGYSLLGDGLKSFTSFRLVKLMRALQMSRWIYSHKTMRGLLETVFRSWQAMVLIGVFSLFSLVMFAVVAMQVIRYRQVVHWHHNEISAQLQLQLQLQLQCMLIS